MEHLADAVCVERHLAILLAESSIGEPNHIIRPTNHLATRKNTICPLLPMMRQLRRSNSFFSKSYQIILLRRAGVGFNAEAGHAIGGIKTFSLLVFHGIFPYGQDESFP
jgi:hypothetical protein